METAEDERRVILTCDRAFVRARHSESTYFVRSERKQEQFEEVCAAHPRRRRGCTGFEVVLPSQRAASHDSCQHNATTLQGYRGAGAVWHRCADARV